MPRLGAVFQIGSLGDSIVSLPALRSLRELLPDCSEYILVDRFDDVTKVLPAEVFEMMLAPTKRLSYCGPGTGTRLSRVRSIVSLSARLRYYRPYYGIYLMPSDRASARCARDRAFFRFTGVSEFVGFQTVDETDRVGGQCPSVKRSEAFLRLRRLWNGQSEEQFAIHGRAPLLEPPKSAEETVSQVAQHESAVPRKTIGGCVPILQLAVEGLGSGKCGGACREAGERSRSRGDCSRRLQGRPARKLDRGALRRRAELLWGLFDRRDRRAIEKLQPGNRSR